MISVLGFLPGRPLWVVMAVMAATLSKDGDNGELHNLQKLLMMSSRQLW